MARYRVLEMAAKAQGRVTDAGDRSTTDVYPPLSTLCRTNLRGIAAAFGPFRPAKPGVHRGAPRTVCC